MYHVHFFKAVKKIPNYHNYVTKNVKLIYVQVNEITFRTNYNAHFIVQ